MFTDKYVPLHVAKVILKTEERAKDERFPVFGVNLVLEPLTYDQAKQLGPEILGHCFTNRQAIREQMKELVAAVDEPEQILIARMAEDVEENCRLRHVRIKKISVAKREGGKDDTAGRRKSKKVAPQHATLRATLHCLIDSADKTHRHFLCDFFARTMFFTFEPEQENLFTGVYTDNGKDEPQPRFPPTDGEVGDVLDEQKGATP